MQLNPGSYLIYNQLQKCRHTPTEIRSFLLKIAASDTCVSYNTYPLPPLLSKLFLQVLDMVVHFQQLCQEGRGGGGKGDLKRKIMQGPLKPK